MKDFVAQGLPRSARTIRGCGAALASRRRGGLLDRLHAHNDIDGVSERRAAPGQQRSVGQDAEIATLQFDDTFESGHFTVTHAGAHSEKRERQR